MDKVYGINETCKLSELKVGQAGKLISFYNENKALRRRLLDMGLTKGVIIDIKMISPLGDPISIGLRGYQLCLRKEDMENILVSVTKEYVVPVKEKKGGKQRG